MYKNVKKIFTHGIFIAKLRYEVLFIYTSVVVGDFSTGGCCPKNYPSFLFFIFIFIFAFFFCKFHRILRHFRYFSNLTKIFKKYILEPSSQTDTALCE